jgi:hypothetical protein
MKEFILLLEQLGIQLLETAEPEIIAEEKKVALEFLNERLAYRQEKLKELKVIQHMATVGHGLIKVDVEIGFDDACIVALTAAISIIENHTTEEAATPPATN